MALAKRVCLRARGWSSICISAAAEKAKENDPADVARMVSRRSWAGKDRIVAGNLEVKLQGYLARFLPENVKGAKHKNMSAHGSRSSDKH